MHVDDVAPGVVLVVPDVVEDALAAEHLVGVPHEELEQRELLDREFEALGAASHGPRHRIEHEIAGRQRHRQGAPRAAQQRAHAGQQLLEGEGLDQVVVGAAVEAGDLVVGRVAGGEHEHRNGQTTLAQVAADAETVETRQHDVEQDQVVLVVAAAQAGLRGASVAQRVDRVAFLFEAALEHLSQLVGVFDHQKSHALRSTRFGPDGATPVPRRNRNAVDGRGAVGRVRR